MCAPRAAAALLMLLLSLGPRAGQCEYTSQSLSMHLDTLLAEYDRAQPPPPDGGASGGVVVSVALDVRHASIDDQQSVMRLLADLHMKWKDPRLVWNASEWEASSVLVSAERVWAPDVALANAGGGGGAGDAALRAQLGAAGDLGLVLRLRLALPVALDLRAWPRDTQEGVFEFASRTLNDDEIHLVLEDYQGVLVVESGTWEMVGMLGKALVAQRADGSGLSAVRWTVRVRRCGAAQAAAAAAALAAATALLAAALALPYDSRPPLAACVVFLSATWLLTAMFHIPGATSTPLVLSVMCGACVCGAVSGAAAALAGRLARRAAPPPAALRALLSRVSAVYVLAPDPEEEARGKSGAWVALARLVDAAAVAVVAVAQLVLLAVYVFA